MKRTDRTKLFIKRFAAVAAAVFVMVNIEDISYSVSDAAQRCLNTIIPSLFIMMVISRYIVSIDVLKPVSRILKPLVKLTGLSPRLLTVFIMSNIGGYPVGISMLSELCRSKEISQKNAAIAASYCFSSGPAFIIGAVGICSYHSSSAGTAMFTACVLANLTFCILYNRIFHTRQLSTLSSETESVSSPISITEAIEHSAKALFSMCSVIVAFSVVTVFVGNASSAFGLTDHTSAALNALTEITTITGFAELGDMPAAVMLTAFGGLCVWLQNYSLCAKNRTAGLEPNKLILGAFLLRIPIAIASGVYFKLLYGTVFGRSVSASADPSSLAVSTNNLVPSICLIIMIFLTIDKKRLAFHKKV